MTTRGRVLENHTLVVRDGRILDLLPSAGAAERYAATVEENQGAQRAGGHYGVPTMVFGGEPFFGQDRFDQMKWRMQAAGLQPRAAVVS